MDRCMVFFLVLLLLLFFFFLVFTLLLPAFTPLPLPMCIVGGGVGLMIPPLPTTLPPLLLSLGDGYGCDPMTDEDTTDDDADECVGSC
uniref:Uncharacterized protein n=1 Tax=Anopheles darlingi TaxID=43151 RepID=A0A2M4DME3_ANODA